MASNELHLQDRKSGGEKNIDIAAILNGLRNGASHTAAMQHEEEMVANYSLLSRDCTIPGRRIDIKAWRFAQQESPADKSEITRKHNAIA